MTGLKLTGFKEMDLVLRRLPTATAKRTVDRAMKAALAPTAAAANGLLPKGLPPVIIGKKLNKNQSRQFRGTESDTSRTTFVGSPSPRAHIEEFGTGPRYQKSGKFTGIFHARPFMRPAWDRTKEEVLDKLKADLAREIEKSVGRLAKKGR